MEGWHGRKAGPQTGPCQGRYLRKRPGGMRGALESGARRGTPWRSQGGQTSSSNSDLKSSKTYPKSCPVSSKPLGSRIPLVLITLSPGSPPERPRRRPEFGPKNDPETEPEWDPRRPPKWTPGRPRSRPKSVPKPVSISEPNPDPKVDPSGLQNGPIWGPFLVLFGPRRGPPARDGDFAEIVRKPIENQPNRIQEAT